MLEKTDLSRSLDKEGFKKKIDELSLKMGELQRRAKEAGIPVMLVFEGWDAAGKGTLINKVLQALDPRGFNVYSTKVPTENERFHPFLWRFWTITPEKGRIAFYDRSWYRRVTIDRLDSELNEDKINNSFEDIINFERQMTDSGVVLLKFFLHISKKEQMRRFMKLQNDPATEWRVTKEDLHSHHYYDEYLKIYDDMIERTHFGHAPWVVIEANEKRFATIKIYNTILSALEKALQQCEAAAQNSEKQEEPGNALVEDKKLGIYPAGARNNHLLKNPPCLDQVDLSLKLGEDEGYKKRLKYCQEKLRELEHEIYKKRIGVVVLYEGWDAAGKGGNIRRFVENLDPRGYEVVPVAAPNDEEKAHHYLWRFWRRMPKDGHLAIFDRTWYGRVMVERIEGFCTKEEWNRAYREINEMEAHLAKHGVIVAKFWLHIDQQQQLERFQERENTPEKNWKITSEDWRNREKWEDYHGAVNDMLQKTSTECAPWTIIESNDKNYGRIKVYETMIKRMEEVLKR